MSVAEVILVVVGAYAAVGVVVGVAFVVRGVGWVDHAAAGAPLGFRLIILPGCSLLWPWVVARWARAGRGA